MLQPLVEAMEDAILQFNICYDEGDTQEFFSGSHFSGTSICIFKGGSDDVDRVRDALFYGKDTKNEEQ